MWCRDAKQGAAPWGSTDAGRGVRWYGPMTERTDAKHFYATQDTRFTIEGGRGGLVKFDNGTRHAELSWEMRSSSSEFDIVVYGEECHWTAPKLRKMTREEVTGITRELAVAVRARIDLSFADGSVDLGPPSLLPSIPR